MVRTIVDSVNTPGSIIDALGGTAKVAEALGIKDNTVSGWRDRGIPPGRWPGLVRFAEDKGVGGVTFEALAALGSPVLETTR